jgi:thiamine-monophosphate kinase
MDISDGLFCDTNKLLDTNKYGMDILKNISDNVGRSGEEYEMLIAFAPGQQSAIERLADSMDIPLTIFAKTAHNSDRYPCKSHHFG